MNFFTDPRVSASLASFIAAVIMYFEPKLDAVVANKIALWAGGFALGMTADLYGWLKARRAAAQAPAKSPHGGATF